MARWCPSKYYQRRWEEWSTGGFWMHADPIFVAARRPLLRWIWDHQLSPWRPLVDRFWKEKLMTCRRGACLFSAPGVLKCLRKAVCKGNLHLKTYHRLCTFVDLRDAFDSLILKGCLNLIRPHYIKYDRHDIRSQIIVDHRISWSNAVMICSFGRGLKSSRHEQPARCLGELMRCPL